MKLTMTKKDIQHTLIYYIVMIVIWIFADDVNETFIDYILGATLLYIPLFIYKKRGENIEIAKIREERKERRTIVSAKQIPNSTTYRNTGSFSWGFIGSLFYGLRGALLGSYLGGKRKPYKVNFIIYYKDGHSEVKTVKVNSYQYKKLLRYTK